MSQFNKPAECTREEGTEKTTHRRMYENQMIVRLEAVEQYLDFLTHSTYPVLRMFPVVGHFDRPLQSAPTMFQLFLRPWNRENVELNREEELLLSPLDLGQNSATNPSGSNVASLSSSGLPLLARPPSRNIMSWSRHYSN